MSYDTILVEKSNRIAIITLNRPEKLNAINLQMKNELYQSLEEIEADDGIRIVIMTGAGKAFSSGHDNDSSSSELLEFVSLKEEEKLFRLDKPVIAAIHGYTLGDGLQQALLCDMIVASENAVLGFIGPKVGGLCYGSFTVLQAVVGRHIASELLFTCDQISAAEAFRIGLVNKVVPHQELIPTAIAMAEKIKQFSPISIKYTKRALRMALVNQAHETALAEGGEAILSDMRSSAVRHPLKDVIKRYGLED